MHSKCFEIAVKSCCKPKFRLTYFLTLCLFHAHTNSGALLDKSQKLLTGGIHATIISESFQEAAKKYGELLDEHLAIPIDLDDTDQMIKVASTSLNSKVV